MKRGLLIYLSSFLLLSFGIQAQEVNVDVNLNVNHKLGEVTSIEREKFITIHADVNDRDWYESINFSDNLIDDFLNGYDVYLGRNTGTVQWVMNSVVNEDPNRPGYADTTQLKTLGATHNKNYSNNRQWHAYESRNNKILCTQLHPFFPDGTKTRAVERNGVITKAAWAFSQADTDEEPLGTASGEFYAHYIKNYFAQGGTTGEPQPKFVEVTNEPLWDLYNEIDEAFKFHVTVAREVKKVNPDVKIAGYCTAFPNLEENNFQRWENRWKKFMDVAGEDMDCWSIHLYDFPSIANGKKKLRRGSNMEATFDMMEQYSMLKFGKVKPFLITEFGASSHDYFGPWTPYRDYLHNTACNAQVMQFLERANIIGSAINYTMLKATWGSPTVDNVWGARLLRRENEPESLTGEWVYSDRVHFYQLWSDVKGKRVDSRAQHLDLMTDAYVDGNKAYVIVNNLAWEDKAFKINLFKNDSENVEKLRVKHYHLGNSDPAFDKNSGVLDSVTYNGTDIPTAFNIGAEGTMIFEYTLSKAVEINETSEETKYYATTYYQPISANTPLSFNINGVKKTTTSGEATLRLGLGRAHGKSLTPVVKVNGQEVEVPTDFRGDVQKDRDTFFGVIEIDVPYEILKEENTITVEFTENGGHISSVAMQVFEFSGTVGRTTEAPVTGVDQPMKYTKTLVFPNPASNSITIDIAGEKAFNLMLYNAVGQPILSQIVRNKQAVDISQLEKGIYFFVASGTFLNKGSFIVVK